MDIKLNSSKKAQSSTLVKNPQLGQIAVLCGDQRLHVFDVHSIHRAVSLALYPTL